MQFQYSFAITQAFTHKQTIQTEYSIRFRQSTIFPIVLFEYKHVDGIAK